MMIIEGPDFRLEQINDHSNFWDVEVMKTIRPRDKEPRDELKLVAYGTRLEAAIEIIIANRISRNHPKEDTISLESYVKELKEEFSALKEISKNIYWTNVKKLKENE